MICNLTLQQVSALVEVVKHREFEPKELTPGGHVSLLEFTVFLLREVNQLLNCLTWLDIHPLPLHCLSDCLSPSLQLMFILLFHSNATSPQFLPPHLSTPSPQFDPPRISFYSLTSVSAP